MGAGWVGQGAPAAAAVHPEERQRRDASVWTLVQGVLAPVQFLVFLVSLGLVLRYLATGEGDARGDAVGRASRRSLLYTIMITGCIWEKVVFGRYLFAPAFFWEDVFSMLRAGAAHRLSGGAGHRRAGRRAA